MFQFIGIENPKACGETVIIYLWNWINFLKNKYSVCVIQGSFLGIYEELLLLNDGKNIVNAQKKTSDNISQGKVRENFSLQMLSQKCLVYWIWKGHIGTQKYLGVMPVGQQEHLSFLMTSSTLVHLTLITSFGEKQFDKFFIFSLFFFKWPYVWKLFDKSLFHFQIKNAPVNFYFFNNFISSKIKNSLMKI